MNRRVRDRLASLAVAVLVGGGLYWLVGTPVLAAVTGIVWGVAALVTLRAGRLNRAHATGDGWNDRRWTGLATGLVTLAAVVGVGPGLPVSSELGLGLGTLVIGVGYAGYVTGAMAEADRTTG
jgi:hypothetical protein